MHRFKSFTAIGIAACSLITGGVFADGFSIPFDVGSKGHILIPVNINGGDALTFVFDTGASITALNKNRLVDLDIDRSKDQTAQLVGMHGTENATLVGLSSVSLHGTSITNSRAILMDLSKVEGEQFKIWGVLGFDFFGKYNLSIDYKTNQLEFKVPRQTCAAQPGNPDNEVPITLKHGTHITVPVTLNGVKVSAIIDSGASRSFINESAAKALNVPLPADIPTAALPASSTKPELTTTAKTLQLSGKPIAKNAKFSIANVPVFELFGLGAKPAALLGADILGAYRVQISYKCKTLSVS
jgi:predicted aspartyl protease